MKIMSRFAQKILVSVLSIFRHIILVFKVTSTQRYLYRFCIHSRKDRDRDRDQKKNLTGTGTGPGLRKKIDRDRDRDRD